MAGPADQRYVTTARIPGLSYYNEISSNATMENVFYVVQNADENNISIQALKHRTDNNNNCVSYPRRGRRE